MFARGSRFLLPGWASVGEARGGQQPGSPDLVPRDLRRERAVPPPYPLRHVTARVTAGTGESHAGDSCCSAGPPRPPSPPGRSLSRRSLLGPPGGWGVQPGLVGGSGEGSGAPSQRRVLEHRARGAPRVIQALVLGCAVAHPVLGGLFIAGGRACGARSRWHCQTALCSFASPHLHSPSLYNTDEVNNAQNRTQEGDRATWLSPHHPSFLS